MQWHVKSLSGSFVAVLFTLTLATLQAPARAMSYSDADTYCAGTRRDSGFCAGYLGTGECLYQINEQQKRECRDGQSMREASARHQQAQAIRSARASLLKQPPLSPERNPLLGRWRVEGSGAPPPRSEAGQLLGMLTNPGGTLCQMVFGSGITEFLPTSWASIDSSGNDSLGPIQYRGEGRRVWAIPDKGIELIGVEITGTDRATVLNTQGCSLVRVAARGTVSKEPPGRSAAPAQVQSPPRGESAMASPSRPSPEICRNTLLDKIGAVGVNQVRQVVELRFKSASEGKVPNSSYLRIDARSSPCDDTRLDAVLYDFDANGMLQAITYVWQRPAGPAPAPIFQERVRTLAMHHSGLPAPQSADQLQADTAFGRLVLQDVPERGLLLEAYAAKK